MKFVFATKNEGKVKEVLKIFNTDKIDIITMLDANIDVDIIEDGNTFDENAEKKAVEIMKISKMPAIADDSGLEIDYMDKKPGVMSARFLGKDTSYDFKNRHILKLLEGVADEKRTARFVCSACAAFTDGKIIRAKGVLEGIIGYEIKGKNGFGYDPILFLPEYNKCSAELSSDEKNKISHRGKALRAMKNRLLMIEEK